MKFKLRQIALASLCLWSGLTFAAEQAIDGIAAIVNNSVITQSQLQQQEQMYIAQNQQNGQAAAPTAQLKQTVLNNMIDTQLILQEAKANKMSVTPAQLNQAIASIAQQNNMTVTQLQTAVTQQKIDWQAYKQQISNQILASMVTQRALNTKINVSDADVANFLKQHSSQMDQVTQYHFQGIHIPLAATATQQQFSQAQTQAIALVASLKKGTNVDIAALNISTNQAIQGGDLGWRTIEQIPPPIAAKINTLQPNEVLGPLLGSDGFYIFKYFGSRQQAITHITQSFELNRILIKPDNINNAAAVQAQLTKIKNDIVKGKSFAVLAKQYSQDSASANKGGNIGWQTGNTMDPSIIALLQKLSVGQVTDPIQTADGFEILQVVATKQIDDTHNYLVMQAKQVIYQQKLQQATQAWVNTLKKSAFIKIM